MEVSLINEGDAGVHLGGCVCGAVRIRVEGRPLLCGICHCFDCRKAHAAPFAAFVVFASEQVTLTKSDGSAIDADAVGAYDNGRGYLRHFCRACGSRIHGTNQQTSDIELHLGLFDETSLWAPSHECWVPRREDWLGELPTVGSSYVEDRPSTGNLPG
jgi:hypothetical protein